VLFGKTERELDLALENETQPGESEPLPAPAYPPLASSIPTSAAAAPPAGGTRTLYDPSIPVPLQISLVGRDEELTRLRRRLSSGGSVALTALNGLPGVGKTALSITLANDPELREHFKDGILWAGLGPEPNMQSHLSRWGTLLGLSSSEMSTLSGNEAWGVALHRVIGSRTMLLVIDDAWTLEDALALKVGGPNCAHLLSTRFPIIATQIAAEGATAIKELNSDEGMVLLRMLAPDVVEREMQRARELVMAVGGLPLALTLIGNYLRMQAYAGPARRVTAALEKLSEASARLNISEPRGPVERHPSLTSDTPVSLRTVIAVTDQQLAEPTRRALHALSVFPPRPNNFSEEAALAVAACTIETLDQITDTGLLETSGSDRYSLHQTIADYARLQLDDHGAYQRLIAYITTFTEAHRKDYEVLEIESNNILAALEAAVDQAHYVELTRIAVAFAPFLLARGLYPTAEIHLQRAYNAAIATADHAGLAAVLLHLGEMTWKRGDLEQAEKYLLEGLEYAREVDDSERICAILANLGSISWKGGDYKQADAYLQEGLELARELGNLERTSHLLQILGSVEMRQGHYLQSEEYLLEGLTLARQIGEKEIACPVLLNLGVMSAEQGDYVRSETYFQEGLLLARQLNHSEWISGFLNSLGDVAMEQGNYEKATIYFQEGLDLARRIEHREWVSFLLLNLGLTTEKQKDYLLSEKYFQESLVLARQIGIPQITCHALYGYGNLHLGQQLPAQAEANFKEMLVLAPEGGQDFIALALYGLARVADIDGRLDEARELGTQSIAILESMGRREAREVKGWLRSLMESGKKNSEE
jgi:tetratricopeptide (TPR) repeat protein